MLMASPNDLLTAHKKTVVLFGFLIHASETLTLSQKENGHPLSLRRMSLPVSPSVRSVRTERLQRGREKQVCDGGGRGGAPGGSGGRAVAVGRPWGGCVAPSTTKPRAGPGPACLSAAGGQAPGSRSALCGQLPSPNSTEDAESCSRFPPRPASRGLNSLSVRGKGAPGRHLDSTKVPAS